MARSHPSALLKTSGLVLLGALVVPACAGNRAAETETKAESVIEAPQSEAGPAGEPPGEDIVADAAAEASGEEGEHFDDPAPGDEPGIECDAPSLDRLNPALLDKSQVYVEQVVYSTSRWLDGLFGESNVECAGNVSRGFVSAGIRWDERDGAKFRARFRARVALPALSTRARLIIGRGDADRYIEGTDDKAVQNLPERFNDFEDQDFLLGLGFSRGGGLRQGFDFGAGIKFSTPLDPYVRARYFINPVVSDRWLWRMTPMLFWQDTRGFGVSVTNTVDFALHEKWLVRSWTSVVEDEVSEGVDWVQQFTAYQSLRNRSALSYSIYATGETENDVPIQDAGVELRYRRSVLREWLFIELRTSLSYPREFIEETRESNIGVGIEFEMQFGEWPDRN